MIVMDLPESTLNAPPATQFTWSTGLDLTNYRPLTVQMSIYRDEYSEYKMLRQK
jgi:hypothetical protein